MTFQTFLRRPTAETDVHRGAAVPATCRSGWVGHIYKERRLSDALFFDSQKMIIGITEELAKLKSLKGADFVGQLKMIAARKEFHALDGESNIFIVGGEHDADFLNLLNAARKAVEHGYKVYILPNPHDFRTPDFIFERRNVFKLFDLKTISGKSIVGSRLIESIGQANRVLLNMTSDYSPTTLARNIKMYFERSNDAQEVLIFKGKKAISVTRDLTLSTEYYNIFMKRYIR